MKLQILLHKSNNSAGANSNIALLCRVSFFLLLELLLLNGDVHAQRRSEGVYFFAEQPEKTFTITVNVISGTESASPLAGSSLSVFKVPKDKKGKKKLYPEPESDPILTPLGKAETNSKGIVKMAFDFGSEYVIQVKKNGFYYTSFILNTDLYEFESRYKIYQKYECNYTLFPSPDGTSQADPVVKIRKVSFNPLMQPPRFTVTQKEVVDSLALAKRIQEENAKRNAEQINPKRELKNAARSSNNSENANEKKYFKKKNQESGYLLGTDTFNILDQNFSKQGKWRFEAADIGLEAKGEQTIISGYYDDDAKTGTWKRYYENEKVHLELPFLDDLPTGDYRVLFPEGNIQQSGTFSPSTMQYRGQQKLFYPNGNPYQHLEYNQSGQKEGIQMVFYQSGGVAVIGEMKDNLPDGLTTLYDQDGNPIVKYLYKKGKLVSEKKIKAVSPSEKTQLDTMLQSVWASDSGSIKLIRESLVEIRKTDKDYDTLIKEREQDLLAAKIKLSLKNNELIREQKKFSKMELMVKLREEENKRQRNLLAGITILAVLVVFFLFFVLKSNREKSKTNQLLILKNQQILHQQKEIEDSIIYASFIQKSLLSEHSKLKEIFADSHLFYRPKNIVSGDFFWTGNKGNDIFIAVADCTGHGVPGAMVSMLASEKLSEALLTEQSPGRILTVCNQKIKWALKQGQQEMEMQDGMDIGLLRINQEKNQIVFSGANRPLWLLKPGPELIEFKPDKIGIGGHAPDEHLFSECIIPLEKGNSYYLFSDGFADQFSSEDKKMMTRRFRQLLLETHGMDMKEQGEAIIRFFDQWKGDAEQTDDVLVMGFRY
jgi:serine phosphatase RsbU (regulator of sigma subunit)/antitoxin component YwqK of YwqJK toxin-antitoxin module